MNKTIIALTSLILLSSIHLSVKSEEEMVKESATTPTLQNIAKTSIKFNTSQEKLALTSTADEKIWVDIENNKHLILKHYSKGRTERGNVLLFHAQGENADHIRLIQPLTKQLTRLGWNVFIPNIAQEDFPTLKFDDTSAINNEEDIPEVQNTVANKEQTNEDGKINDAPPTKSAPTPISFFKTHQEYQNYFIKLCQTIFEQTELGKMPSIIITNQNTSYWSIPCLKINNQLTPMVFLQPQLPKGIKNNLSDIFFKQTDPIFSFHVKAINNDSFYKAFKKRLWRSKFQRFNIGMLTANKLQKENILVAKTITGWVEKQRAN